MFLALTLGAMTTVACGNDNPTEDKKDDKEDKKEVVKFNATVKEGNYTKVKMYKNYKDGVLSDEITDGKVEEGSNFFVAFVLNGEDDVVSSCKVTDKSVKSKSEVIHDEDEENFYIYKFSKVAANIEIEFETRTETYVRHTVTFKNANGDVHKTEQFREDLGPKKPTDLAAPAGQRVLGWKIPGEGNPMWDFKDKKIRGSATDLTLEPVFVKDADAQYLEAELCPAITDGDGMDGATYSGGAKGAQLIRTDENYELGSTCEVEKFSYYLDKTTKKNVVTNAAPAGVELKELDPKADKCGYFVHFMYEKGDTLTFNVVADKADNNVAIVARFSAEYGIIPEGSTDRQCSFSQTSFPISVNGVDCEYGTIEMHNIPIVGDFLQFRDYLISTTVSLNAGNNIITMKVDNNDTLNGTIAATAPCIDSLKVYTSSKLTWSDAKLSNLIKN